MSQTARRAPDTTVAREAPHCVLRLLDDQDNPNALANDGAARDPDLLRQEPADS
ncbi:hypothetical protein M2158_004601 [Streptomyces sp. SAI-144]|uniref:hypothetical protein n=1 Tax=Streptomyces sp. SAI-144 TaxID=2940544 RepID=UPI002476A2E0|nr:hypothetical protein [Streptomyces sp. SAI-144]MDH6436061.1 hypothetical protein [Streptomyces sp. SAI-144]